MIDLDISKEIKSIKNREQMIRYLDGYCAERKEEIDERKTKRPLVKSYMLEHTGDHGQRKELKLIMSDCGLIANQIDDYLFQLRLTSNESEYIGFMELLTPRYFVFYSTHLSKKSDKWARNMVCNSPEIDHVWLSGLTFNVLWKRVIELNHPNRYAKIMFSHESVFQVDDWDYDDEINEDDEKGLSDNIDEDEIVEIKERRASKFSLVDRIFVVEEKLAQLQNLYTPLYAINQLRFPSPVGQGGHDFFDNGKVTNKSGNFRDHRNHIIYIQRIYDQLMQSTEKIIWYSMEENITKPGVFQRLVGAPVTIRFNEPLTKETFDFWINSTFGRINNRFRLWGNPIWLGPQKVHVYGVDKHLWRPIFMEITNKHLIAVIPKGTCGNTVHRLVTNIQRFIDPAADVYIGSEKYNDIVKESSLGVMYEEID